jgi:3-hydroxymyristoyl/3-hydroxydecanoyl-(acyl carrier protein) dehydratase
MKTSFSENEPYILYKHVILVKNVAHAYEVYTAHFPKKLVYVLSVRPIDFSHKVTPREVISKEKKLKNFFEKISR